MAAVGALEVFPQIQTLVLDKLQVLVTSYVFYEHVAHLTWCRKNEGFEVSYKWLSRNFLVSSNHSKRLLQEFVEQHSNELAVIYTLSGWLKSDPQTYCVKLASAHKLAEVKQIFKDNCSVQVYSVQACIPNDHAVIWNTEFVQAEKLFNQPSSEENCLRDNRFCSIANLFVKRIVDGKQVDAAGPWAKESVRDSKSSSLVKGQLVHPQEELLGKSSVRTSLQSTAVSSEKIAPDAFDKAANLPHLKESVTCGNTSKNKRQNEKGSSGTGSLASLWSNSSAKPKAANAGTGTIVDVPDAAATAEAQICAQEAFGADSSEDEDGNQHFKRQTHGVRSKNRRVILDFSDDEEEAENTVSVASAALPERKLVADFSPIPDTNKPIIEELKEDGLKDKQERMEGKSSSLLPHSDTKSGCKISGGGISLKEKIHSQAQEGSENNNKDGTTNSVSTLAKRRKVLKTRIDDRGREVTEVVWEGETTDNANLEMNKSRSDAASSPLVANKAHAPVNSAPLHLGGKGGNKKLGKGGTKDAKQGNIMSFFKRV